MMKLQMLMMLSFTFEIFNEILSPIVYSVGPRNNFVFKMFEFNWRNKILFISSILFDQGSINNLLVSNKCFNESLVSEVPTKKDILVNKETLFLVPRGCRAA